MRAPAFAIAREFRQRLRWPVLALAVCLLVLGTVKLLILGPGQPIKLDPPDGRAGLVILPLSVTFMYFLAVFSFGLEGDLVARQSIYPTRLFTLPVTSRALVGWPMLYGMTAMASLWLVTALFARWPWEIDLPWIWPALLGATFLAWTQALAWMPYGLPGLRVVFAVLWLASLDAIVLLAIHFKASEPLMVAFLAPQIPLAFLVACFAVARARSGEVPDWRRALARLEHIADVLPQRRDRFRSPGSAQVWFEWHQHGRLLPLLVALVVPFELALLFVVRDAPVFVVYTLLGVLLTPPLMASFVAALVSKANPAARDSNGVAPFIARRPLTSAALVAAKLKATVWSTLATWLLVVAAIPIALTLSSTWPVVLERAREGIEWLGTLRATVVAFLGLSALLASTWKQLVQSLYIGLTGSPRLIRANVLLVLSFLVAIGPVAQWIIDSKPVQAALLSSLPWILGVLVGTKVCAAGWVATRLYDSRLLGDRTLVMGAACWMGGVLALYGLLAGLLSTPLIPRYFFLLVAILEIPLARISAAPLALAWNRHR